MIQKSIRRNFGLFNRLKDKFGPSKEIANQILVPESGYYNRF